MDSIRIGMVSAFHADSGTVDVRFFTAGDPVATGLTMFSHEYRPLDKDDMVLCAFTENGGGRGVCLGRLYSDANLPVHPGEQYTRVSLRDGYIEYDRDGGTLTIGGAPTIILLGSAEIHGNVTVTGGDVVADGVSLKGHGH